MAKLTSDRNTQRWANDDIEEHPVKGGVTIFGGALVCLDAAGWAVPGRVGTGLVALGRAEHRAAPMVDGAERVRIRRGVMRYANSAGADRIDRTAIGKPAFIVDDQTVALMDGAGGRSIAGTVRDVEPQGVWIKF